MPCAPWRNVAAACLSRPVFPDRTVPSSDRRSGQQISVHDFDGDSVHLHLYPSWSLTSPGVHITNSMIAPSVFNSKLKRPFSSSSPFITWPPSATPSAPPHLATHSQTSWKSLDSPKLLLLSLPSFRPMAFAMLSMGASSPHSSPKFQ